MIRLYGSDRYQTSSKIADWETGNLTTLSVQPEVVLTYQYPGVVNGGTSHFADALSTGPFCGYNKSVMLLTQDSTTENYTVTNNIIPNTQEIHEGYVTGAENVLSAELYNWLTALVVDN